MAFGGDVAAEKRKRDEAKLKALEVAAKSQMILDYFEAQAEDHPTYRAFLASFRDQMDKALTRSEAAALNMGYRELRNLMERMHSGDRAELLAKLEATFGTDVSQEVKDEIARAQAIVRRGRIADLDEYATLRVYLEQHAERAGTPQFVEKAHESFPIMSVSFKTTIAH